MKSPSSQHSEKSKRGNYKNFLNRTFWVSIFVITGLSILSFLPDITFFGIELKKIDILSDIKKDSNKNASSGLIAQINNAHQTFNDSCKTGVTCIRNYSQEEGKGLDAFYSALDKASQQKVRIAFLGDSFIEGDILTGDLRDMLQKKYGGQGVGFTSIDNVAAHFRKTCRTTNEGFNKHTILDKNNKIELIGLSGQYFTQADSVPHASFELKTLPDIFSTLGNCNQSEFFYKGNGRSFNITARVNGSESINFQAEATPGLHKLTATNSQINSIRWHVDEGRGAVFYGATLENSSPGVFVDNFALRSNTGKRLIDLSEELLRQIDSLRHYDLIVLQYGLNIVHKRCTDYSTYEDELANIVKKLKHCMPNTAIMIFGMADRCSKGSDGNFHTMNAIKSFIIHQENAAIKSGCSFWNTFEAMGGEDSMEKLVESSPPMANKDYTHINFEGGAYFAKLLYDALVWGKQEYDRKLQLINNNKN